jgi:hypothetical protein
MRRHDRANLQPGGELGNCVVVDDGDRPGQLDHGERRPVSVVGQQASGVSVAVVGVAGEYPTGCGPFERGDAGLLPVQHRGAVPPAPMCRGDAAGNEEDLGAVVLDPANDTGDADDGAVLLGQPERLGRYLAIVRTRQPHLTVDIAYRLPQTRDPRVVAH